MHATPRISSSRTFDPNDPEYMRGLLFIAVPYFVLALLILLAFAASVFAKNMCPASQAPGRHIITRHEVLLCEFFVDTLSLVVSTITHLFMFHDAGKAEI